MENQSVENSTKLFHHPTQEPTVADGDLLTLVAHTITFLLGVPGNCLILRVYWTKAHKNSTHILIMALAWADLAVCLLRWRRISVEAILLTGGKIPQVLDIILAITTTAVGTSVMITSVIAVDRYDCVCRSNNRFFTKKRAEIAAIIATLFSVAINIPAFISMSTDPSNSLLRMLVLAFQVFCFMTALVMIAVCYGLVYVTIRKHVKVGVLSNIRWDVRAGLRHCRDDESTLVFPHLSKNCETQVSVVSLTTRATDPKPNSSTVNKSTGALFAPQMAVSSGHSNLRQRPENEDRAHKVRGVNLQRKTTKMLFLTSLVFLLTWLPYWTNVVLEFAAFGGASINPTIMNIVGKSSVLLYINNAVNPLIYGLANRRFRKDCVDVLQKIKAC